MGLVMKLSALALVSLAACSTSPTAPSGASAKFELANTTAAAARVAPDALADGTSLQLKILAVYLVPDVDPTTGNNVGTAEMIWINPQCNDDISNCNIDGFVNPAGGPRITDYFDLSRPTDQVNADLNSQAVTVTPGSYKYVRVELCKALDGETAPTVPAMTWRGPGMTADQPFWSGSCGSTSTAFDPPLALAIGDSVQVTLGYDLATSIVAGAPGTGQNQLDGNDHWYQACVDVDGTHRTCMDAPDFAPSATKL
jgi:hypothetical protein